MKRILNLLVILVLFIGVVGCSKRISKITTNDLKMNVDETREIDIKLEPEGIDAKGVTCKISNDTIAKLDGLKVIGLKEGNTAYICSSKEIESKSNIVITMTDEQKKAKEEADKIEKEKAEAKKEEDKAKKAEADAKKAEEDRIAKEKADAKAAEDAAKKEAADRITNATMGQKNALKSGKDYLNYSAFSHSGLIEQLEFEGYSKEDATFAADNCGADWNAQATKSAKEYLDYSSFSRDGLIEQLVFEGFTQEQAEYGVSQVGY